MKLEKACGQPPPHRSRETAAQQRVVEFHPRASGQEQNYLPAAAPAASATAAVAAAAAVSSRAPPRGRRGLAT